MELPEPEPGLVIRYAYLWSREADRGEDTGRKDRPCAIIVAVRQARGGIVVYVAPITHAAPTVAADGVEMPAKVKQRLGLDDQRSWVVTTEFNAFAWPGPDVSASGTSSGSFAYGHLPGALTRQIIQQFRENVARRRARPVKRSE